MPATDEHQAFPSRRVMRRAVLRTLARSLVSSAAIVTMYFLIPLDAAPVSRSVTVLTLAGVALGGVVAAQLRAVVLSPRPAMRAVEALAVSVPSLVLLFASGYVVMSQQDPASFSEPLSRLDAMYFSLTTLATVGYGDITARSDLARAIVSLQMIVDLVVLGLGLRVVLSAVQLARQRTNPEGPAVNDA